MKKLLSFIVMTLMGMSLIAKPVDPTMAVRVAQNFAATQVKMTDNTAKIVYTHPMPESGQPAMYVVNVGSSAFVIVAADDIAHPVLGYSMARPWPVLNGERRSENGEPNATEGSERASLENGESNATEGSERASLENGERAAAVQLPSQVSGFLDDLASQIQAAQQQNITQDRETAAEWQQLLSSEYNLYNSQLDLPDSVGPLLTTTWDQGQYYNALCPEDANGPDGHAVTGCVATAMAQIINYWGYPVHGRGTHSYNHDTYGTLSVNYDSATYDYANMPDALTSTSTPQQVNAVAKLMYDCGVAVDMQYGATTSSTSDNIRQALIWYFGYVPEIEYLRRDNFQDYNLWDDTIRYSIGNNRPVIYSALDNYMGHTFVCDGYNTDGFFHFNYGWGGSFDGWYATSAIIIAEQHLSFSYLHSAILNILPQNENYHIYHNGLYYNIVENGVQVTYEQPVTGFSAYHNYPDTVVIPSFVVIDDVSYPVVSIGENAFQCCWNLKSVVMPNTIKNIGDYAFYSDNQIENVILPDSLVAIGRGSFLGTGISGVDFPNTLTTIGIQAFSFTSIRKMSIPRSITAIGEGMCLSNWAIGSYLRFPIDSLRQIYATEPVLDTVFWNADSCTLIQVSPWNRTPPFHNNNPYVIIGENVKVIPNYCFAYSGNDTITIPENVIDLADEAFTGSPYLKCVYFNAKKCRRAMYLIYDCPELKTVIVGDSVSIIPDYTFCNSTTDTNIARYFPPFRLSNVVIGNAVDTIGYLAFGRNFNLESITIPSSVRFIGAHAFSECIKLKNVYMPDNPPLIGAHSFHYNADDRLFIVPCHSYDVYCNAEGWDSCYFDVYRWFGSPLVEYRNSIWAVPESPHQVNLISSDTIRGEVEMRKNPSNCDSTAIIFANAKEGYHLDHWSTGRLCNPDTLTIISDTTITAFFVKDRYFINGETATAIIFTDFENDVNDSIWRLKNGNYVNRWCITDLDSINRCFRTCDSCTDLLVDNKGRALFISNNNGLTNDYYNQSVNDFSYVFAYCPMNLDTGLYYGSFDWRSGTILNDDGANNMEYTMAQSDLFTTFLYPGDVEMIPFAFDTGYTHYLECWDTSCCMGYDWEHYLSNSLYTQVELTLAYRITNQFFQREFFKTSISTEGLYNLLYYWRNGRTWNLGYDFYVNCMPAAIDNVVFGKKDTSGGYIVGADTYVDCFDTITLTAVPNYGYHFACWSDYDTTNNKQIVVTDSMTCIAFFEKNRYVVSAMSDNTHWGSVMGSANVYYNSECTLTAVPSEGYRFIRWDDDCYDNPRVIRVTKDTTLIAIFDSCKNVFAMGRDSIFACNSYFWNGNVYNTTTELVDTLSIMAGCDSIATHYLVINNPIHTATTEVACETYTWNGTAYAVSGDYTYNHLDVNGCTQVDTLHLTINNPVHTATTEAACETYTWNGTAYTVSGDYTYGHLDNNGCTQVDTLHLTINHSTTGVDVQTACDSYTWIDGNTYAESNFNSQFSILNSLGCDSTVTLNLTVNHSVTVYDTLTIGSNELPYDYYGNSIDGQGNFTFEGTTSEGCDSTTHLFVIVNQVGIGDVQTADGITLFPNPTSGTVTVSGNGLERVEVMDVVGRTMLVVVCQRDSERIDLSDLPQGTYVVCIIAENGIAVRRVVKR